jgi:hypothetical protein
MKIAARLSIALALALVLSVVSLSVWAAPNRPQTVPNVPVVIPANGVIPVTGGTFTATLLGNCQAKGDFTRVVDPLKVVGSAAIGFVNLTDGVQVTLDKPCDCQICYPYPTDYEAKNGGINKWDPVTKTWVVLESTISGNPKLICVTLKNVQDGLYTLLGK